MNEFLIVIICLFFGILLSSCTSSIYYRIPNNIPLSAYNNPENKPFCSKCKHPLRFYEYYSVLSWFFCRGKCNYCGEKIDRTFTILEFLIILNSIIIGLLFGFSDNYLLFSLWFVSLLVNASILNKYHYNIIMIHVISAALLIMIKISNNQPILTWLPESILQFFMILLSSKKHEKSNLKLDNNIIAYSNLLLSLTPIGGYLFDIYALIYYILPGFIFNKKISYIYVITLFSFYIKMLFSLL